MPTDAHTEIIHFSGHVQGVGFRYATLQTAKEFAVVGEVSNLADGRVKLIAQGAAKEVAAFRSELVDRMQAFIRETDVQYDPMAKPYTSFMITQ